MLLMLDAVFIWHRLPLKARSAQATGCSARISALRYPDRAGAQSADWPTRIRISLAQHLVAWPYKLGQARMENQ